MLKIAVNFLVVFWVYQNLYQILKIQRLVAIGDFHGDAPNTLKVLELSKLVKDKEWIGKDTIMIQTGDIVDRGPDTLLLYQLLFKLRKQSNGNVVQLLGNHEVMNMAGDLRYVDPMDYSNFGGREARFKRWSKQGTLGKYLRTLDTVTILHKTIFVHGGLHPNYARLGLDQINTKIRQEINKTNIQFVDILFDEQSPMWFRGYAQDDEQSACPLIKETLELLNADRMVMGHTPQMTGKILARCNLKLAHSNRKEPRIYVIDVGISRAYGAVGKAALEILVPLQEGKIVGQVQVNALYEQGKIPLN